jgi:hypothetical protein
MKSTNKKPERDPLITQLVRHLRKRGVKCGYGDEIAKLRKRR